MLEQMKEINKKLEVLIRFFTKESAFGAMTFANCLAMIHMKMN